MIIKEFGLYPCTNIFKVNIDLLVSSFKYSRLFNLKVTNCLKKFYKQATRCPPYIFCELIFDQTIIIHFRTEFNSLQLVNKTLLYVQQGKCPLINIQKDLPFFT